MQKPLKWDSEIERLVSDMETERKVLDMKIQALRKLSGLKVSVAVADDGETPVRRRRRRKIHAVAKGRHRVVTKYVHNGSNRPVGAVRLEVMRALHADGGWMFVSDLFKAAHKPEGTRWPRKRWRDGVLASCGSAEADGHTQRDASGGRGMLKFRITPAGTAWLQSLKVKA